MNIININNKFNKISNLESSLNFKYRPYISKDDSKWKRHIHFKDLQHDFINEVALYGFSPFLNQTYNIQEKNLNIMKYQHKSYHGFIGYVYRRYKIKPKKNKVIKSQQNDNKNFLENALHRLKTPELDDNNYNKQLQINNNFNNDNNSKGKVNENGETTLDNKKHKYKLSKCSSTKLIRYNNLLIKHKQINSKLNSQCSLYSTKHNQNHKQQQQQLQSSNSNNNINPFKFFSQQNTPTRLTQPFLNDSFTTKANLTNKHNNIISFTHKHNRSRIDETISGLSYESSLKPNATYLEKIERNPNSIFQMAKHHVNRHIHKRKINNK